jgi:hypothetical protein
VHRRRGRERKRTWRVGRPRASRWEANRCRPKPSSTQASCMCESSLTSTEIHTTDALDDMARAGEKAAGNVGLQLFQRVVGLPRAQGQAWPYGLHRSDGELPSRPRARCVMAKSLPPAPGLDVENEALRLHGPDRAGVLIRAHGGDQRLEVAGATRRRHGARTAPQRQAE